MNGLRDMVRRLGLPGIAAVVVLAACAVFYGVLLRPAEKNLASLQTAARNNTTGVRPLRPTADTATDNLQRFYLQFPPTPRLNKEVEKLWILANEYKIDLQSGEYRLEMGNGGLVRYRITLPVKTTYAQLRLFVDTVLKTIPTIAIDGLRFERKKISDTQLDAQIRLTLYFRPDAAAIGAMGAMGAIGAIDANGTNGAAP